MLLKRMFAEFRTASDPEAASVIKPPAVYTNVSVTEPLAVSLTSTRNVFPPKEAKGA
jgi:hypothetical protein